MGRVGWGTYHRLVAAGVERAGRMVDVRDGRPLVEDGRVLHVANVIWCTGFDPDLSWIAFPCWGPKSRCMRGVVVNQPGLYFVGLHFLNAAPSGQTQSVGRDAERVVKIMADRARGYAMESPHRGRGEHGPKRCGRVCMVTGV